MKSEHEPYAYSRVYQDGNGNTADKPVLFSNQKSLTQTLEGNNTLLFFGCCLVDYSSRQFACIYEHCQQHTDCFKNELLKQDFDFHALHFHPDDKNLFCFQAFPDILRFIDFIPDEELPNYRLSFNHRYIHKDGNVTQFLHEGVLTFPDSRSLPVLNLNVFTNMGDMKTDETMILTIFRYSSDLGYQKVFTKVYSETSNSLLSQREKEIIKLCLEGLSSKMIAAKLNLSIHTVKNHKRNCMEKTMTHNIAELIHLCNTNHWL